MDAIREAFAGGRSARGEELLTRALEDDLPWDVLTRAVAQGVERCHAERLAAAGSGERRPLH